MKVRYINNPLDNALILGALAKATYNIHKINEDEFYVLAALKRANPALKDKSPEEISEYLQSLDEEQMAGLANNVKGIAHEMQFVELENADGDQVSAALFTETNHEGTDVVLTNEETGEVIEVQLKATDNSSYVNEWIQEHPNGEILVTEEVASRLNLKTSGISNDKLTTNVDDFLDRVVDLSNEDSVWDYIPEMSAVSLSIIGYQLFKRYRRGEITYATFRNNFIRITGIKAAKFAVVSLLMLVPGVNVVVGATLLFQLLYGIGTVANRYIK